MKIRMPNPTTRDDSSLFQFRRKVPVDIRECARGRVLNLEIPEFRTFPAVAINVKLTTHAKLSLRTRDPECAKFRMTAVSSEVDRAFERMRAGPLKLTHKEAVALSKGAYDILVARFGDDPGENDRWQAVRRIWAGGSDDPWSVDERFDIDKFNQDYFAIDTEVLDVVNEVHAWLRGKVGDELDGENLVTILREVDRAIGDAATRLHRASCGDYRPDPAESRFPVMPEKTRPSLSLTALFERWQAETKPSPNTVMTWNGNFRQLREFLGHDDVGRLTEDDVIRWKDHLLATGRKPKTVNDSHLAALRSVLAHSLRNKVIPANPAQGVRAAVKSVAGEGALPYDDAEVSRLLDIASRESNPYKRFLPLLAAATGARIGEISQLHASHVVEVDGVACIKIEPTKDGGRLKNAASERTVPIHKSVIDAGFLDFVTAKGSGPLFYRRSSGDDSRRHASKGVANHTASWIRSKGFTDPRKAPCHALRHWWKSAAFRAGVQDSVADFLQGHRSPSVAARYRHFDIPTLAKAVSAIPIPVPPAP